MLLKERFIHKTYTFKKSIGFFIALVMVTHFGIGVSYGMGSIKKIFDSGGSNKKTTIIRGIVYDKSKPVGQGNIAGAKVELLKSNSLLKEVSSNAQGYYEISLKLSSGSYKVACKANNFKQAEISSNISKGRTYNTGFDFSLEPIDNIPPVIKITPVKSPTNQNVALEYTVSDNVTPVNEIQVTGGQSRYTENGVYKVTLTAKDKANNISTAQVTFTIDKISPVIVITSPQNGVTVGDSTIQLQGTVDGVSFSESRTLNSGENTLTKTATDSAGNPASALITVYLYLGELIGPEGGQVSSADGKVKVIIPAGALTEPTRIRISKIDKDTMQDALPSGRSLLSIVECKPYGLVFKKPVELIYSLEQAEVPGTPVELGFFDAVQDKIIPTGQTTTVPVDGYTVKFSLLHFSTYACLDYVSKQGAPIGAGVQIPLPDLLTGSFSHAIPITVPPGRKGMQPSIGLSYRSSNSNSWVGLGFSLNSGYIVRSTRLGPPSYDDKQDTFYFITEAGTTELVHLIDNLYQAKVESGFTKFFKEPDDSWKVVTKDGAILRFGQTTDSKETSNSGTFSWYITKAIDTNGNYIEYYYTKDQGKSYLSRIDYTGNETGVSPTNSVQFGLESREDIGSSYISTARIATTRRLKEVEAKVKGELVWRYELEYGYSPDSNRSLLKSVKQSGSDGKSLPVQRFGYQKSK